MRALLFIFLLFCLIAAAISLIVAAITGVMLIMNRTKNRPKSGGPKVAFCLFLIVAFITAIPPLLIGGCVKLHQRRELEKSGNEYVETKRKASLSDDGTVLSCAGKKYYKLDMSKFYNAYSWSQEDKIPYAEIPDLQVRYNSASLSGHTHPKMAWKIDLTDAAFQDALLLDNTLYWEESIYEQAKQYYQNPNNSKLVIYYYSYCEGRPFKQVQVDVRERLSELETLFLSDANNCIAAEKAAGAYETFISAVVRKASLDGLYLDDGFYLNDLDSKHCCYWLYADGKWRGVKYYLPFSAIKDESTVHFEINSKEFQIPLPAVEQFLAENCPDNLD